MRTIKFLLAILFSLAVVACGGAGGYGGGSMGGSSPTYIISGNVKFSGSNLLGAMISLAGTRSSSTTTNSSGNYSFTGLPNGSYTVTPSGFGYTYSTTTIMPVSVSGNNPIVNFTS
jgi:hypothetical protein